MPSSLFSNQQPSPQQPTGASPSNPMQAAVQAVRAMRAAGPEQLMRSMMRSNPQFAQFVEQNRGKSPEQIAREHGIDLGSVMQAFK